MAFLSIVDAESFDVSKSYFNKLKSKEEECYLVLENYRNQEVNEMVKAVIVKEEVTEMKQGILYIKMLEHSSSELELEQFLEEHVDPVDVYTYVIKLEENYVDLRKLTEMVDKYTESKVRFIGGNLLAIQGAGVGMFADSFITENKLKVNKTSRFEVTQVKLLEPSKLVTHEIEEYTARKNRPKKSTVKRERAKKTKLADGTEVVKPKKPKSVKSKTPKPKKQKLSMEDILNSY
ncbi:hypothetical protein [Bacillus toyonensis]|uniref:hypothetical protein n=1 Tax=Bacillus toyonensis TaxID=155322 RepID=UPI000BF36A8A|nr:hypothetical protein [Bacillus toyonensis]PGF05255.1 hypothetical protein COM61_02250 [Bacillus toyonensis]